MQETVHYTVQTTQAHSIFTLYLQDIDVLFVLVVISFVLRFDIDLFTQFTPFPKGC